MNGETFFDSEKDINLSPQKRKTALLFCDRIAVVENGHIMEIDQGRELMNYPKSLAGLKLSGCKNTTEAVYVDDHRVYCPYCPKRARSCCFPFRRKACMW